MIDRIKGALRKEWIASLARNNDIHDLCERIYEKLKREDAIN